MERGEPTLGILQGSERYPPGKEAGELIGQRPEGCGPRAAEQLAGAYGDGLLILRDGIKDQPLLTQVDGTIERGQNHLFTSGVERLAQTKRGRSISDPAHREERLLRQLEETHLPAGK